VLPLLLVVGCDVPEIAAEPGPTTVALAPAPSCRTEPMPRWLTGTTVDVDANEVGIASVRCDAGTKLVTGGCRSAGNVGDLVIVESTPLEDEGWRCAARAWDAGATHLVVSIVCEGWPEP
jgi:hypothetical protein